MRSMQLSVPGRPLQLVNRDPLRPGPGHVLVRVHACRVQTFALEHANEALAALREGRISGAAVLLAR